MPLAIETTAGGRAYANPFIGGVDHPAQIKVDVSGLTIDEVDQFGYLKPGVPLAKTGILVGADPAFVYGMTFEAQKIVPDNPTNVTLAAVTADPIITINTVGHANRDVIEDNLGRALTANEIAGFDRAGSKIALSAT
jgi:hypothetical protein